MIQIFYPSPGELGLAIFFAEKDGIAFGFSGRNLLSVGIRDEGEYVGIVQFYGGHGPGHVAGMTVMVFDPQMRATGIGKEGVRLATAELLKLYPAIKRIEVFIAADNGPARKGAEAIGFLYEGLLKHWYPRKDSAVDAAVYGKVI